MRKAVIDVGSNSVLLLVAERGDDGWAPVFETSRVTALGDGTKETGLLGEPGMTDTLAAIERAFDGARSHGAESIFAGTTMAARIATNAGDFLARAQAQNTPVTILSGDDEARLGFLAVANDPTFTAERISIIDPGGQSTELVVADRGERAWHERFRKSFPVGTLGLRGDLLDSEVLEPSQLLVAVVAIDDLFVGEAIPEDGGEVVVLGATGTNLITIREGMTSWDPARVHGATLTFDEVSLSVARTSTMTDAERAAIVGIEPGREKTIHIGSLILERFMHRLRAYKVRVSVRGWRYAALDDPISG